MRDKEGNTTMCIITDMLGKYIYNHSFNYKWLKGLKGLTLCIYYSPIMYIPLVSSKSLSAIPVGTHNKEFYLGILPTEHLSMNDIKQLMMTLFERDDISNIENVGSYGGGAHCISNTLKYLGFASPCELVNHIIDCLSLCNNPSRDCQVDSKQLKITFDNSEQHTYSLRIFKFRCPINSPLYKVSTVSNGVFYTEIERFC